MKRFLSWLIRPDVAPLLARLALVALTALLAEPLGELPAEGLPLALGLAGEAVSRRFG